MPINHTSLPVSSLSRSTEFYRATLAPLGYKVWKEFPGITVGFSVPRAGPDFWITGAGYEIGSNVGENEGKRVVEETADGEERKISKVHLAFTGTSQRAVREWYDVALKAGATCNGPPGPRPQYHAGYYAAFVLDPDGHNIEVVNFSVWWITALQWAPSMLGAVGVAGLGWWFGSSGRL